MIEELDEQCERLIKKVNRLPEPLKKWFCIAAADLEPEYQAMMLTVTDESDREWLMKIRTAFTGGREAEA